MENVALVQTQATRFETYAQEYFPGAMVMFRFNYAVADDKPITASLYVPEYGEFFVAGDSRDTHNEALASLIAKFTAWEEA